MNTYSIHRNEYPNSIWDIFLKKIKKLNITKVTFREGNTYQLLEVMVAKIFATLEKEYEWSVTRLYKDEGIDFKGEKLKYIFSEYNLVCRSIIIGQCKRSGHLLNIVKEYSQSLVRIPDSEWPPDLIILASAARLGERSKSKAIKSLDKIIKSPKLLLSITDLDMLFSMHFLDIESILKRSLTKAEYKHVKKYFSSERSLPNLNISFSIKYNSKTLTGKVFSVFITIEFSRIYFESLKARIEFDNQKRHIEEIIFPNKLLYEFDLKKVGAKKESKIIIKMRGFHSGWNDLGEIKVFDASDKNHIVAQKKLGKIFLEKQYISRFFDIPHKNKFQQFNNIYNQLDAGHPYVICINGKGGVGKSRLSREIGIEGEKRGAKWISVSHTHTYDDLHSIFLDLMYSLIPNRVEYSSLDRENAIIQYFKEQYPSFSNLVNSYIANGYFENVDPLREKLNISKLLLSLMLKNMEDSALIIHISDLHWAGRDFFEIVQNIINTFKLNYENNDNKINIPLKVLFIFEGRYGERSNKEGNNSFKGYSTEIWENYSNKLGDIIWHLKELDEKESNSFLDNILGCTEIVNNKHTTTTQIGYLKTKILEKASGNPFFMIEVLKDLDFKGFVKLNKSTGFYVVQKKINKDFVIPQNINELALSRFNYLNTKSRAYIILVKAISLIKDRVEKDFFYYLIDKLNINKKFQPVLDSELLIIPTSSFGTVRFRHEIFYENIKKFEISLKEQDYIAHLYLSWHSENVEESAEYYYTLSLILEKTLFHNKGEILRNYKRALTLCNENRNRLLMTRIYEKMIQLYPESYKDIITNNEIEIVELVDYRYQYGRILTKISDFKLGEEIHIENVKVMDAIFNDFNFVLSTEQRKTLDLSYLKVNIDLANAMLHRLKIYKAIEILQNTISRIEEIVEADRQLLKEDKGKRLILLVEAVNRLGVAFWFEGEYNNAIEIQNRALKIANDNDLDFWKRYILIDKGFTLAHIDSTQSLSILSTAEQLFQEIEKEQTLFLATFEKSIVELVDIKRDSSLTVDISTYLKDILNKNRIIANKSREYGYIHEETGASFVVSICSALLEKEDAFNWFQRTIDLAFFNENLELLWKIHLDIAQYCLFSQNIERRKMASFHADKAYYIIDKDLKNRIGIRKTTREFYYKLPLAHILRIRIALKEQYEINELERKYPYLRETLSELYKKDSKLRTNNQTGILFIKHKSADFFLFN